MEGTQDVQLVFMYTVYVVMSVCHSIVLQLNYVRHCYYRRFTIFFSGTMKYTYPNWWFLYLSGNVPNTYQEPIQYSIDYLRCIGYFSRTIHCGKLIIHLIRLLTRIRLSVLLLFVLVKAMGQGSDELESNPNQDLEFRSPHVVDPPVQVPRQTAPPPTLSERNQTPSPTPDTETSPRPIPPPPSGSVVLHEFVPPQDFELQYVLVMMFVGSVLVTWFYTHVQRTIDIRDADWDELTDLE
jgi:hypothetical protein